MFRQLLDGKLLATYSVLVGAAEDPGPFFHVPDEDVVMVCLGRLPRVRFRDTHQGLTVIGELQMMDLTCAG